MTDNYHIQKKDDCIPNGGENGNENSNNNLLSLPPNNGYGYLNRGIPSPSFLASNNAPSTLSGPTPSSYFAINRSPLITTTTSGNNSPIQGATTGANSLIPSRNRAPSNRENFDDGFFIPNPTPHPSVSSYNSSPQPQSIQGYGKLEAIYPYYFNSVSMYRSINLETNEPVLIKVSNQGSLEDLTRIRHEWSVVYSDSIKASNLTSDDSKPFLKKISGILRPERCLRTDTNPAKAVLIYPNRNNLVTLRERYIASHDENNNNGHLKLPDEINSNDNATQSGSTNDKITNEEPEKINFNNNATENSQPSLHVVKRSDDEIKEIIQLMIGVLKTVSKIHKRCLTHNGLTTSTIFIDDNNNTFISGWDFSFLLRAEDTSRGYRKTHLKQIADCMGYVSPETTGLTNRLVDYRADFYSIGCIIYELLLGVLPFRSSDPSELGHMHVLRTPVAPSVLASWIPVSLSQIIMKLLEKNADERYQAAKLIISDLELVLQSLEAGDMLDEDFMAAAVNTVSAVFTVPQLIYGREDELEVLHSCYKRSEENSFQFVFCVGEPGSGKSRLINELERSSIARNTFFCVSKFDQYQRGAPFYSIVTVLKDIVHQILSGSVHSITQWRDNIITNLKVDLAVLFGPIPELKELLGHEYLQLLPKHQRPLGPVPREMRFKFVVKSLFCLFGAQGLTVFLDDIQWCPPTEMSLFRELTTFANEKYAGETHITFVCASTPDNKQRHTSLVQLAKDLNLRYFEVPLSPLNFDAVREIVNDTLCASTRGKRGNTFTIDKTHHRVEPRNSYGALPRKGHNNTPPPPTTTPSGISQTTGNPGDQPIIPPNVDPQVESLTETLYQVTNGNPLFISLLLKFLYYEQFIYFDDPGNKITGGKWKVDFDRLMVSLLPKSVTDVVITMMDRLPENSVRILRYAACICSNTFTLEDLAIGADVSFSEAASALHFALDVQLILPITIHYKFPFLDPVGSTSIELYDDEVREVAAASTYRFYHDLVQQAVYSRLEEKEALEVHRLIGLRLLGKDHTKPRSTHKVIEIANQLKNAVPIVKPDERPIYIELNVRAGNAVYGMSDFDMAHSYFDTARILLPADYRETYKGLSKEIFLNLVELQYNRKKYNECLQLIEAVFPEFVTCLDQASLLRIKAKALYGLGRTSEAITIGICALNMLGIDIDEREEWNKDYHEKLKPRIPTSVSEIRELVNLKAAEDARYLLVHEIVSIITIPVILSSRDNLFRSLVYTAVLTFVDYGSSAPCSFSLLSLASIFQRDGGSANLTRAYEYSKLAIVTLECDTAVGLDFGINIYEYYALTLAIYFEPLSEVLR